MEKSIILNFVQTYWIDISIVAVLLVIAALLIKRAIKTNNYAILRRALLETVLHMEKLYGSGTGEIKLRATISEFRRKSKILSLFTTDELLIYLINETVQWLKKYLQENNTTLASLEEDLTRQYLESATPPE